MSNKKICNSCQNEKELSEFYKDKRNKLGVGSVCKDCFKEKYIKCTPREEKIRAIDIATRECIDCKKRKDTLNDFYIMKQRKINKHGEEFIYEHPSSRCKECYKENNKKRYDPDYYHKYYLENKNKILEYSREHYLNNKERRNKQSHDYVSKNRKRIYQKNKEWLEENPNAAKAYNIVLRAHRNGDLVRPDKCECCGREVRTEYHHESYDEPLKGVYLCRKIHRRYHKGSCEKTQSLVKKLWKEKWGEDI